MKLPLYTRRRGITSSVDLGSISHLNQVSKICGFSPPLRARRALYPRNSCSRAESYISQVCNEIDTYKIQRLVIGDKSICCLWSDKLKTVMWIKLTSPWEQNMTRWYFDKHDGYRKIGEAAEGNGKKVSRCVLKLAPGGTSTRL